MSKVILCSFVTISTFMAHMAWAQSGTLDPTFGNGGVVQGDQWGARTVQQQSDGRLIVLTASPAVLMFDTTEFPPIEFLEVEQWLQRFLADGTLDVSFGVDGTVVLGDLFPELSPKFALVQADDRILLVGDVSWSPGVWTIGLARLLENGEPDLSYGIGGVTVLDPSGDGSLSASGALLDAAGRLLVHGSVSQTNADLLVVRCNVDGNWDTGYGTNGRFRADLGGSPDVGTDRIAAAALQPDGKLLIIGHGQTDTAPKAFFLGRLTAAGNWDDSFGNAGVIADPISGPPWSVGLCVATLPDGKILAIGHRGIGLNTAFLRRYHNSGEPDMAFGTAGERTMLLPTIFEYSMHSKLLTLADGNALFLLRTGSATLGEYDQEGTLMPWFGDEGLLHVSTEGWSEPMDMLVQPDGRIVVVASSHDDAGFQHLLMYRVRGASLLGVPEPMNAPLDLRVLGDPLGPGSALEFTCPRTTRCSISVTDASGRDVLHLLSTRTISAGSQRISLAPLLDLPSGRYHVLVRMDDVPSAAVVVVR